MPHFYFLICLLYSISLVVSYPGFSPLAHIKIDVLYVTLPNLCSHVPSLRPSASDTHMHARNINVRDLQLYLLMGVEPFRVKLQSNWQERRRVEVAVKERSY